jgi:hypothetical protein
VAWSKRNICTLIDTAINQVMKFFMQPSTRDYRGQDFNILIFGGTNSIVMELFGSRYLLFAVTYSISPES